MNFFPTEGGSGGEVHIVLGCTGSGITHTLECDTDKLCLCSGINATGYLTCNGTVQTKSRSVVGNTYYGYGQCYAQYDSNYKKGDVIYFSSSELNDNRGGAVLIYSDISTDVIG